MASFWSNARLLGHLVPPGALAEAAGPSEGSLFRDGIAEHAPLAVRVPVEFELVDLGKDYNIVIVRGRVALRIDKRSKYEFVLHAKKQKRNKFFCHCTCRHM